MSTKEREILLALDEFDRSAISLVTQFGPETRVILDSLENHGAITVESAPSSYNVLSTLIKISSKGKTMIDPEYCSVCECLPCDCNWGHDE